MNTTTPELQASEAPQNQDVRSLRDQVYQTLEKLIISGTLRPGERLAEGDLAERLGVSRNPVREALAGLSRAGWVELRPRHGASVRRRTVRQADQFFQVRRLLEVESARLAAARATPETVARLETVLQQGCAALEASDAEALVALNSQFHAEVVRLADNELLGELLAMLDKRLRWYFSSVVVIRGPDSWREHAHLVEAIAANDETGAAEAMIVHTEATRVAYMSRTAMEDS